MKPVNLNQFRKAKARADQKARADENSQKFGRTKSDKARESAEITSLHQHLDAHKRDDDQN